MSSMSKKKKQELTPKERLQQALVPQEEQPYDVPENWSWIYFTSAIDVQGGTQPPKSTFIEHEEEGYVRLVQIRDFSSEKYKVYIPETSKLRLFDEDDILIARYGASLGRVLTGLNGAYNVALAKTIFSEKDYKKKFVYWMLQSGVFQTPLLTLSRTAQAGFNKGDLSGFPIPLPPLPEQHRIVTQIETLFHKLDTARTLVQSALDSFENRRAAILHKAFTGELTVKWREEHGVSFDTWVDVPLGDLIESGPQNGLYKPQTAYGEGCPIVRIDGFYDGHILDFAKLKRLSINPDELKLYGLKLNDVIINRVNSIQYLGKSALVRTLDGDCVFESNIMRLGLKSSVDSEYIVSFLNCAIGLAELRKNAKHAVNQASINQGDIKGAIINLPTFLEQQEVVRLLSILLEKESVAKELTNILTQIDHMKKSILARAFRGQLGTNDPAENSILEEVSTHAHRV